MERSRSNGSRIIVIGAAVVVGLLFGQLLTSTTNGPAYAVDLTPTPAAGLTGPFVFNTPTPMALAPAALPAQQTTGTQQTTGAQQASDQIAAVSQQVTQAVHDQSLSIEAKVQRITSLADQFNKLVAQWQQQLPQALSAPVTATSPVSTPTPVPVPGGAATSDQLHAQIAAISQQMAQVSQDPSLPPDVKTQKLSALSTQFNQLMAELQQQP